MIDFQRSGDITPPLSRIIGSKTGLVSNLYYNLPPRTDPVKGKNVNGKDGDIANLNGWSEIDISLESFGKGTTLAQGVRTQLGETVERYTFHGASSDEKGVDASYDELSREYDLVDPSYLHFYKESTRRKLEEHHPTGTDLGTFNPSEDREWYPGQNLITGEKTYLPSELVLSPVGIDRPIFSPTTNGLACHETTVQALLGSIYEYVERDAFMKTWWTETAPTRIETEAFKTENELLTLHLLEYETGIDLPMYGCLGVTKERNRHNAFFSGGANLSPKEALETTLREVSQCWTAAGSSRANSVSAQINPDTIANLKDNVRYYGNPANAEPLEFLCEGRKRAMDPEDSGCEDPREELQRVLEILEAEGTTPIGFDITTPAVRELGLVVTRVVIPELLQLSLPSFPTDGHPRLKDKISNEAPHPYP